MAENRDPAIKLFGKTIQIVDKVSSKEDNPDPNDYKEEAPTTTEEEEKKNDDSSNSTNESKIDHNSSPENSNDELDESNNNPQNKSNKKPDKILPCPRCKSMDTKFCYYNNYNVNQPRHFCKCCQRYWTAGGSMRNVPVGAGRRKSKTSTSNNHLLAIPESIHHFQPLKTNGTVLNFGSDAPLISSVMNLIEKKTVKIPNQEQLNETVKVSSNQNCSIFPPNVSNINGTHWPYPWTHPPYAFPFYPITAYWTAPWPCPPQSTSPGSASSYPVSNSPNLGKHSREGNLLNYDQKCLWVPKTMRADAPEKLQGMFKAFQSKGDHKIHSTEVSQALLANPAALSRSFTFQESS